MTEIIKVSVVLVFGVITLNLLSEPNTEIFIGVFNTHIPYFTVGILMMGWLVSWIIWSIFFDEYHEEDFEGW